MTTRTKLAALVLVLAGGLSGLGASGSGARAAAAEVSAPRAEGRVERDWTRGAFWRPADSAATRPLLRLERAAWSPHSGD